MVDRSYRRDGPVVCLIGSGPMPVQCATLLTAAGFDVAAVHSPDPPLLAWGDAHDPYCAIADFDEFRKWAETIAYDYLFSIINFKILPSSLIRSPQILAINYHDAPLPKYAGSHALAHALKNGETSHGVTWHVMTERVDAGDILQQKMFPLAPDEPLVRAQQRATLAALRAFRDLLPTLHSETYTRTPQDLSQRTFYRRAVTP